jgi:hypothetical protein
VDAALEWQAWDRLQCGGCGRSRLETFDPDNEDAYDVEVYVCHACAARDRSAHKRAQARDQDAPPPAGEFFSISGPTRPTWRDGGDLNG